MIPQKESPGAASDPGQRKKTINQHLTPNSDFCQDNIQAFRQAAAEHGLTLPNTITPNKIHSFPGAGKKNGNTAGRCLLFPDMLGGWFQDWSNGGKIIPWRANQSEAMTPAERRAFDIKIEKARAQAAVKKEKQHAEAAIRAADILRSADGDPQGHPYVTRKKISPVSNLIKRGPWPQRGWADALLIPLYNEKKNLVSIQAINEDGKKDFLKGAQKAGAFFPINNFKPGMAGAVVLGEGYATVAAVCQATGYAGVVGFDCGNLLPVAKKIRDLAPKAEIVLLADDDQEPGRSDNPGLEHATRAATKVEGKLAVPGMGRKADFWDVFNEKGPEAVREIIAKATAPEAKGAVDCDLELNTPDWPKLDRKTLPGVVGEFVDIATRDSEADPAAVLLTFMTRFGAEVGPGPYFSVGESIHRARLASVVVGASSKARKGTSAKPVERVFKYNGDDSLAPLLGARTSKGPFSSGEGIIFAVRDEVKTFKGGEWVVADPGAEDKRLFVLDEEFGGVLANTKREGNVLSMVIRQMWDSGDLDPLTKNNKISATGAHVCWVSHITSSELHQKLAESESFNGFANRILWCCARRQKIVPFPEPMPIEDVICIQAEIFKLIAKFKEPVELTFGKEARAAWGERYYPELTADHPGLAGCVINRGEAQALRLAMIYAMLAGHRIIGLSDLEAAVALWDYCRQSAMYIFHGYERDVVAQKIIDGLQAKGTLNSRGLFGLFSNNIAKNRLELALTDLINSGKVSKETVHQEGRGRPEVKYFLTCQTNLISKGIINSLNSSSSDGSEMEFI